MIDLEALHITSKVRFTGRGGYDEDNKRVNKILTVGSVYTVIRIEIDRFSSEIHIEEFPKRSFSTVFFEDV